MNGFQNGPTLADQGNRPATLDQYSPESSRQPHPQDAAQAWRADLN